MLLDIFSLREGFRCPIFIRILLWLYHSIISDMALNHEDPTLKCKHHSSTHCLLKQQKKKRGLSNTGWATKK